jgi:hypothetical protein
MCGDEVWPELSQLALERECCNPIIVVQKLKFELLEEWPLGLLEGPIRKIGCRSVNFNRALLDDLLMAFIRSQREYADVDTASGDRSGECGSGDFGSSTHDRWKQVANIHYAHCGTIRSGSRSR